MLDHRVYRAAFVPAVVALFVVAFSLADRPAATTTRLAPVAFDANRAFGVANPPPRNSLRELVQTFPSRLPGGPGDAALADRIAGRLVSSGFARRDAVRRESFEGDTLRGPAQLENVVAVRPGLSSRAIVIVAHRDAAERGAAAQLSGTAAMLELARVFADRDLRHTVVLASVSGGSGGFAGARRLASQLDMPVDAVLVLGDVASTRTRRPFVVPWGNGRRAAPSSLRRSVEAALRRETRRDPGSNRAAVQFARRALALTASEQGALVGEGLPAVLVSATGELGPAADAEVSPTRLGGFGRGLLRAVTAIDTAGGTGPDQASVFGERRGIILAGRLLPDWAVRLLVGALLLPALLAAADAFFRVRRRGLPVGRWTVWAASMALPLLAAWAWARLLDLVGAIDAPPAPVAGDLAIGTSGWLAMASAVVVVALGFFGIRPLLLRRAGARGDVAAGGAAAAAFLLLAGLAAAVWVVNPYAAAVLLPAAHAWLLAGAPERQLPRGAGIAALIAGLVLPAALVLYYADVWGLGPVEALWSGFLLAAGGTLGPLDALVICGFAGIAIAAAIIVLARRRAADAAPPERLRTRGPVSYAGPGSLGGTESALRR